MGLGLVVYKSEIEQAQIDIFLVAERDLKLEPIET